MGWREAGMYGCLGYNIPFGGVDMEFGGVFGDVEGYVQTIGDSDWVWWD